MCLAVYWIQNCIVFICWAWGREGCHWNLTLSGNHSYLPSISKAVPFQLQKWPSLSKRKIVTCFYSRGQSCNLSILVEKMTLKTQLIQLRKPYRLIIDHNLHGKLHTLQGLLIIRIDQCCSSFKEQYFNKSVGAVYLNIMLLLLHHSENP